MKTIFVSIASYRDEDCKNTIQDLFAYATYPDRITVGVCYQAMATDPAVESILGVRPNQIKYIVEDASSSKGPCWARAKIQSLIDDEDFYLQIDSHMRFEQGWDELLIKMLNDCPSEKPILSMYPPMFKPPRQLFPHLATLAPRNFIEPGILMLKSVGIPKTDAPISSRFVAAGFLFAPMQLVTEVPYDAQLYFEGEEISLAVRLWTSGWDMFAPNEVVIYHFYNTGKTGRRLNWEDNMKWYELDRVSRERVLHLTGVKSTLLDLGPYGLGSIRSLTEYEQFAGIDFKARIIRETT